MAIIPAEVSGLSKRKSIIMSGFDPKTGIFQLNASKMQHYLRIKDPSFHGRFIEDICEELFIKAGFLILNHHPYGFNVVADDADVWEVLSGKPSTFGRSEIPAKTIYANWLESETLRKSQKPKVTTKKPKAPKKAKKT